MKSKQKPIFIDLFAGAGGLSIGLEQAGFELVAATDWDHWSCETLRANHPSITVKEGDIVEIDLHEFSAEIGNVDRRVRDLASLANERKLIQGISCGDNTCVLSNISCQKYLSWKMYLNCSLVRNLCKSRKRPKNLDMK